MTDTLAEKTCTPCRGGVPPLARDEALRLQAQAPNWELRDDAHRIERTFRFRNFREALALMQRVGELAESEGHHPCNPATRCQKFARAVMASSRPPTVGPRASTTALRAPATKATAALRPADRR